MSRARKVPLKQVYAPMTWKKCRKLGELKEDVVEVDFKELLVRIILHK